MSFNETQLKRVGMAEAFTHELKKKMEEGVPVIQHAFKKEYDSDKVEATLHLKKSAATDHYFLNKFDLALQKDGQGDAVKQTFYVSAAKPMVGEEGAEQKNRQENKYTLKEAYNLLAGRPVHKHLVSKEGNEYEAWVKLNFKNKLNNGNHEMKQYTQGYGFDLKSTLLQYPIAEMRNEVYGNRLVDSLQRGNLQKVTFQDKEGKEEKLYVSPNITLGALNVYDENKQRLSLDKLIEKNYIGEKLAGEIKQRASQEQKPEQTQKNDQTISQKNQQKQKHGQEQKNDSPKQKQKSKQKIN